MIVKENIEISGKDSDSGFYIERDGVQYSEAIDPSEFGRTYTETDVPIEDDGELNTGGVLERR